MSPTPAAAVPSAETPEALAQRVGAAMFADDTASRALGMTLDAIAPGSARLSMTIRDDMLNGHGSCHGGLIFTLADSAFAFACNSRNQKTVAAACQINFLRPGIAGERLTADAVELSAAGKLGLYDICVRNAAGDVVAQFRGQSYRLGGEIVPPALGS